MEKFSQSRMKNYHRIFEEKRKEKLARAQKLKERWSLLRACIEFIEENADWQIANKLERKYKEKKRIAFWERELRMKNV